MSDPTTAAVREDELPRNVEAAALRTRRFRPLTAAEARHFLDATRADRLHTLYELALRTGLRKGELLGLCWEDLDLAGGTATSDALSSAPTPAACPPSRPKPRTPNDASPC